MVTRCPACSTAFNVNSQQLASAKGAVRCGSCLQVFKAIDHLIDNGLVLNKTTEANKTAAEVHEQAAQTSTPESLHSAPSEEFTEEKQENQPAASWDDYPRAGDSARDSSLHSDFQELTIEDNEEDPFSQVDQNLAEQLDQELDEAFSEGLDIEPPATSQPEDTISSFESVASQAPTTEAIKQESIATPKPEETPTNNDFFNELSQLAEQSLDAATLETTSFGSENESGLATSEEALVGPADSAEASNNLDSNSNELSLSFDDKPAEELIADKPDSNDLNIGPLQVEFEEEQALVVDNSPAISEKAGAISLEEPLEESIEETAEELLAGTNSLALEVEAPEERAAGEEPRFIDDDTEHFTQKPDSSHSLPQAFSSEHQEQDEDGLDESWALEMMMKELEATENNNEPSKIEQALDRKHPPEQPLFAESENHSDPFFAPEANHSVDEGPRKESEFDELDLSGQLEDALSMDTIDAGNLSLAQDSEYNLEQPANAQASHSQDNAPQNTAIEPSLDESTLEQETLSTVDTSKITPVNNEEEPSKAEMIDSIEPEPLEMEFRQEKPSWNWLWGSGALMAIVLAVGQFAWLKFDDLNLQPPYRGFYQTACNFIGCSLPPQVDLSKLKASNLVVRSHPEEEQALVVDMVLLNLANFEQEFPDIRLSFSDIDGKAIAGRTFRPSEYLAGELAGASIMPTQRPIHLSLEIVDPGEEAVNYKVDVR